MTDQTRLDALLLRYEEHRVQDTPVLAEELCEDCPELMEPLKRQIQMLERMNGLLNGADSEEGSAASTEPDPARPAPSTQPAEALRTGSRYQVLRFHASGGLGEVHVARDEELHREVALKRLHRLHSRNPNSRSRFLREAEITSRLEHPSIVPVHSMGEDADGCPFYAMRFIQGQTLREAIEAFHAADRPGRTPGERPLTLRQLLSRFVGVCNTVAYAHSKGIVHRDLKPNNIMLGPYGETLVVDWGLAKEVGEREGDSVPTAAREPEVPASLPHSHNPTQTGMLIGTPAYMSPEQAAGRWDLVCPASDVYSLGATLYALLTGAPPFHGGHVGDLVDRVKRGSFPPPRQVKPGIPRALEAICLKAMARQPGERYLTALQLGADLEHWLGDEPVSAWREPWTVRIRRWLGRHRTAVAAAVATVSVAMVSLAAVTWLSMDAKARAQATAQQLAEALHSERAAKNQAISNLTQARHVVGMYYTGVSDHLWRVPGSQELRKGLLEAALQFYDGVLHQMPEDPGVRAEVARTHNRLGYLAQEMGSKDKALEEYLHALSFWESVLASGRYESERAHSYNLIGAMQLDLGQRVEALRTYQRGRTLFQRLVDGDASPMHLQGLALSCHGLAELQEQPAAALSYFQQAISVQKKLVTANPNAAEYEGDLAQSYNNFGTLQILSGQQEAGLRSLEEGRALRAKLVQNNRTNRQFQGDLANSYHTIGDMQRDTDPATARRALEEARGITEKLFQTDSAVALIELRLAEIYHSFALLQQATDLAASQCSYEQAGVHFEKVVQAHPAVRQYRVALAQNCQNLGTLRRRMKQPAEARRSFEQACVHWDWVLERDKGPRADRVRLRQALAQAYLAEHARATDVAKRITEQQPSAGDLLYDAARVYSISAATVLEDSRLDPDEQSRLAEQYALEAVTLLAKARALGYFQNPCVFEHLKKDSDLCPLRSREDFRKLVKELEENNLTGGQ